MYQRYDVVEIKSIFGGGQAAILDIKYSRPKYPYVVKMLTGRAERLYKLGENQIARKLRELDIDDPLRNPDVINIQKQQAKQNGGQEYAAMMAQRTPVNDANKSRWKVLALAIPGESKLIIKLRGKEQVVTFLGVNPRSPKYVFSATNQNGTTYKYPLGVVVDILQTQQA